MAVNQSENHTPETKKAGAQIAETPSNESETGSFSEQQFANLDSISPAKILRLQHTHGNQAVLRMLGHTNQKNRLPRPAVQRTMLEQANQIKPPRMRQSKEDLAQLDLAVQSIKDSAGQIDSDAAALEATIKEVVKAEVGTQMLPKLNAEIQNALTTILAESSERHLKADPAMKKEAAEAAKVELNFQKNEGATKTKDRVEGRAPQGTDKEAELRELQAASLKDPGRFKTSSDSAVSGINEKVSELAAEEIAESKAAKDFVDQMAGGYLDKLLAGDKEILALQNQIVAQGRAKVDRLNKKFDIAMVRIRFGGSNKVSVQGYSSAIRDYITNLATEMATWAQTLVPDLQQLAATHIAVDENSKKIEKSVKAGIAKAAKAVTSDINSRKNKDIRHQLKTATTEKAKDVINGDDTFDVEDTQAGDGSKRQKGIDEIAKEAVNASLSGPLNSRLATVGSVIGGRVPNDGDKLKIDIMVKVPVDPSGIAKVGFHFMGDIKNDDKNLKARLELSFVGGGDIAGLVEALGEVGGYLDAASSTDGIAAAKAGETMMSQISYALYRQCRKSSTFPNKAINWMWGMGGVTRQKGESEFDAKFREAEAWAKAMEKKFLESKDKKDKVEMGYFAALTAEAKSFVDELGSAKGQFKYLTGTKYNAKTIEAGHKSGASELRNDRSAKFLKTPKTALGFMGAQGSFGKETDRFELSGGVKAGPFAGELKAKFLKEGGLIKGDLTEVEVEGAASMMTGGVSAFADPTALGVKITNTIVQYGSEIAHLVQMGRGKKENMSSTDDLAVATTDLGTVLSANAGTYSASMVEKLKVDKLIIEGGKSKALKGALGNYAMGASGLKLSVKYSWKKANPGEGKLPHKIEFTLDYVSSLSAAGGGVFKGSYDKSRRVFKLPAIEIGSGQAKDDANGIKGFEGGLTKTAKNFKDPAQWYIGADTVKNFK